MPNAAVVRAPRWKIFGPAIEQHTHTYKYKSGAAVAALTITSRAGGGLVDFAACTYTIKPKAGGYCLVGAILGPACVCGGGNESPHSAHERENRRKEFFRTMQSLYFCYCAGRVESHCASGGEIKKKRAWGASGMKL
jgi:hypothetical protein